MLGSEELRKLYFSPNTIIILKWMGWGRHVAYKREIRNVYRILAAVLEGKMCLGRPSRRCGDVEVTLEEMVVWNGVQREERVL
jgi:hypothetical protein